MKTLIASYSETNRDDASAMSVTLTELSGESFENTSGVINLDSCQFFMRVGLGSPTGTVTAQLYAMTGTLKDGTGTGSALAVSDTLNISTFTGSYALATLNFTGANRYLMANNTNYVIALVYSGGGSSDYIQMGLNTSGSSVYPGSWNRILGATYPSGWTSFGTGFEYDACFYVYGVVDPSANGNFLALM